MDIIFMGTPDFAVLSLEQLVNSPGIEVKAVVTQPDRPRGRGQKLQATPVKARAEQLGIAVMQTDDVNQGDFLNKLRSISPDLIVVVAFGQKLGKELLTLPPYGCINLHASLLPEYRGSSPIHQAIIDGRGITGVTTMHMAEGWDDGDIIFQEDINIGLEDTVGTLHDKLAYIGADLLARTVLALEKGTAPRRKQDDSQATYAFKIEKTRGLIDWHKPAEEIFNLVRGVNPWPGAYTYLNGDLIKIWEVGLVNTNDTNNRGINNKDINNKDMNNKDENSSDVNNSIVEQVIPGMVVVSSEDQGMIIQTGRGQLKIKKLQLAGKRRMTTKEYLRGYNIEIGDIFEEV